VGIGFGVFIAPAVRNIAKHRDIPLVFGFKAYGGGPFETAGIETTIPLLLAFGVVCALEIVAGSLLWGGRRSGAILGLSLLPFGAVFWWGFALPIPPLLALARSVLILVDWNKLH